MHLYLAEELTPLEEKRELDEDEFVEVLEVPLSGALKLMETQDIYDAKTAYAVQYLELRKALQAKMKEIFADMHIHIGRTESGRPVKITAARTLTLDEILIEASEHKGMELIGIIDCHSPEVLAEIEKGCLQGVIQSLKTAESSIKIPCFYAGLNWKSMMTDAAARFMCLPLCRRSPQ